MSILKTDFLKFGENLYEIVPPLPTEEDRGGIIASPKTDAETVEVKLGDDGKLYVNADASGSAAAALSLANENTQTKIDALSEGVDGKLANKADKNHNHTTADIEYSAPASVLNADNLEDALMLADEAIHQLQSGKADKTALSSHTDNSKIHVTQTEKDTWNSKADASALANKADKTHPHVASDITDLQTKLDSTLASSKDYTDEQVALLLNNSSEAVDSIMELATAMQENEDVVDALEEAIGNKADKTHSHSISEVTNLQTTLDGKVPTSRTVNGKALSSNITLSASDVGADASGAASAVQSNLDTHAANTSLHFTTAEKTKLSGIETGAQKNTVTGIKGNSESSYRTGNVNITKANIGLGNVDNTSDENKPVSTAQQTAIDNALESANNHTNTALTNYYTKTQIDSLNLISVEDIDAICGTTLAMASEVMF